MYQNKHGRFTAPDPLLASTSLSNPQTFNRYSYVGNNPVNMTDPSGLIWCDGGGYTEFRANAKQCKDGERDVTGLEGTVSRGSFTTDSGYEATKGDRIKFNAAGTTTLVRASQENTVAEVTVQAESDPAAMTGDVPVPTTTFNPQDALPLPCPTGGICSGPDFLSPSLGPATESLKSVQGMKEILHLIQLVPAGNVPATIILMAIDVGQGEFKEAGLESINLIPFEKGLRYLRRADEVSDAARLAPCLLCFVAGTQVQTIDGLKPIEEIKIGDQVLSYNELTQQNEYQVVYNTFRRFADDIYSIKIENEEKDLEVTSEHPFYIKIHQARDNLATDDDDEGEWEEVRDLEVGDEIRLVSGGWAKILDIKFKGKGQVFNFSVANNNNYYVGNSRLLTHNSNGPCKWAPGIQNYQAGNMTSLQHVITRHGPNALPGVSQFTGKITEKKLMKLSKEMFKKGIPMGNNAIIHDFGRIIGIDKSGAATSFGAIYLNNARQIRTMFPF